MSSKMKQDEDQQLSPNPTHHPPLPPTRPRGGIWGEFVCVCGPHKFGHDWWGIEPVCLYVWSFSLYWYETLMPFPDEVLNLSVCIVCLSVLSFSLYWYETDLKLIILIFPWWGTEPVSVSFSSLVDEHHWYTSPLMRYRTCPSVLSVCDLTICMSPLYWM